MNDVRLKIFNIIACIICIAFLIGLLGHACASGIERTKISELSVLKDTKSNTTLDIHFPVAITGKRVNASEQSDTFKFSRSIAQNKNQSFLSHKPTSGSWNHSSTPIQSHTERSSQIVLSKLNVSQYSLKNRPTQKPSIAEIISSRTNRTVKQPVGPLSENAKAVVQANNQFAFDVYSCLAGDSGESGVNIFFSPWSISSAFALTYEGARGNTADEIRGVFHFPSSIDTLREGYLELSNSINGRDSGFTLNTANALWAEKTYSFLPDYVGNANRYYDAKTTNLDFVNNPGSSRHTINSWVEEKTKHKITDLVPEGGIDPSTVLVITNAIYFKGTWLKQFDPDKTMEEDFILGDGTTLRVPMMTRTDKDAEYWYTETDNLQVLGMPYAHNKGKGLSMLVLLPKETDLESIEASLSALRLEELNQALTYQRVMVSFPRFKMETTYSLSDTLSEMGMPSAFRDADFSGMDGSRNLFIDEVYHKAYIDVNEEGTEAAAATAVVMNRSLAPGEPIPVFRADHPFLFLIQDNDTGNILFMGRMVNPADV